MNKKEAIEMLELTVGAYLLSGKADDTRCMQWREMLEAIEKDAEPVRRWIPCSERLPEEDGYYITTMNGEICGCDHEITSMCGYENGKWDEGDMVIAWMPLPDPYTEVEHE